MSTAKHKEQSPKSLVFCVITISDSCSKGEAIDGSGKIIVEMLMQNNSVSAHKIVPDDKEDIVKTARELLPACDCLVTTGGTGLSARDVTIEALSPLIDKEISGFGELFRRLSYDEVGSAAIISSALAGVIGDKVVFCLPGSVNAVKLGTGIILKEANHIIKHVRE